MVKVIKILAILMIITFSSIWSSPSFSSEDVQKIADGSENIICEECEYIIGLEKLEEVTFSNTKNVTNKGGSIGKYLRRPSPISQDIAHLTYLKEADNERVVFWYTLFEF